MGALSDRLWELKKEAGSIDAIEKRAKAAGYPIDRATIDKYLRGKGAKRPPESSLRALAAGFKTTVQELRRYARMPEGEREPWVPPDESARLDRDQRNALDLLIKAIVRPVIKPLPTSELAVNIAGMDNEVSPGLDEAQQVGEDKARTRQARSKSARRRKPKDVPKDASFPDKSEDAAI